MSESFDKAASHVRAKLAATLDNTMLLKLYGLYKQATEGPCRDPKPSWYNTKAKSKWDAWNSLGSMPKTEACNLYVTTVKQIDPEYEEANVHETSGWSQSVSKPVSDETPPESRTVFDLVKEGALDDLRSCSVDCSLTDGDGLALIHWAADRGNAEVVQLLLNLGCDVNLRDGDGQTALHYAASCDHRDVVELLIDCGADHSIADADGVLPVDVAASEGPVYKLLRDRDARRNCS